MLGADVHTADQQRGRAAQRLGMSGDRRRTRTASHWGSYWITTAEDEVVGVDPVEHDPDPSPIGANFRGTLRGRTRITRPAVREGWLRHGPGAAGRGSDGYVEVSWDEVTALIASEVDRVRTSHGNSAIYGSSYGWGSAGRFHHAQSQLHRFLNTAGGYTRSVTNYSFAAEAVLLPHVVGDRDWLVAHAPRWSQVAEAGQYVLAFGGLPRSSTQVNSGGVGAHVNTDWQRRCAAAGVQFTIVAPSRSDTAEGVASEWVPARPGTDVALMLALCHELLVTDRYDRDFVQRCCVGFEQVRAYLLGARDGVPKSAGWAADICDLPVETITTIADRIATLRTLVTTTWSMQRQHHGEMSYWAAITLAAMSGSMGRPGGGFSPGVSSMHSAHVDRAVSALAALPQGHNPVPDFIPVARVSDMLLTPGAEFDFDGGRYRYPDIRLVYWAGGNPFHHHQDLNKLLRAWQAPETVIVHEPYWNAMAKHADIVVPVATALEREDIACGTGDRWVTYSEPAAQPPPGIRTDYEVFSAVAAHLGLAEEFTEGRDAAAWVRELYQRSIARSADLGLALPPWEELVSAGAVELALDWEEPVAFSALRADPAAHPLATPSGKVELYSATIAGFGYDDCPGQATWLEPAEWLGAEPAPGYRLHLLSPQPAGKLHSQLDHGAESRRHKVAGRTAVELNPRDARERGLAEGEVVEVYNDRGRCLAGVRLNPDLRPGVAQLPTGSWYDPLVPGQVGTLDKHGHANLLTSDRGTSRLAQGPTAHTCLVEVRRWDGEVPPVTAHEPPVLVSR